MIGGFAEVCLIACVGLVIAYGFVGCRRFGDLVR